MDLVFSLDKEQISKLIGLFLDMQTVNKDRGTWQNTMPLGENKIKSRKLYTR